MSVKYNILIIFVLAAFALAQDPFSYSGDIFGGGFSNSISWADYNNDGFQDIFISNGHNSAPHNFNYLYKNNGDGTFDSVATGSIVTDEFVSGGSTWGDYDDDGDLDLFVAEIYRVASGLPYKTIYSLYENNGDGTFTRSDSHGDLTVETEECGAGAAWGDFNNDGYIDLALSNQRIFFQPLKQFNSLYLNNQDGTFTKQSNLMTDQKTHQSGLAWNDYDQDGDMDLAIAAGREFPDIYTWLFINNGPDSSFNFDTLSISEKKDSKGISWGDYDNDGDMDMFVTINGVDLDAGPKAQANELYRNDNGVLNLVTINGLTTDTAYTYASAWGDYDNDGDLDIFIGNSGGQGSPDKSYIYENNGDGTFSQLTNTILSDSGTYVHAAAWADYDRDGDIDLMVVRDGSNRLFTNQLNNENHFINIKLIGVTANKNAIGSIVKVKATINGQPVWQMREVSAQTGYGSQNSLRVHFGLGDATTIDSIEIDWAGSSTVDYAQGVAADQFLTLTEGQVSAISTGNSVIPSTLRLDQNYPNPFNPTTMIHYQLPEAGSVQLTVFNTLGQKVATLVNEKQIAGGHHVAFNAAHLSSGLYYYRLDANGLTQVRKMLLVK